MTALQKRLAPADILCIVAAVITALLWLKTRDPELKALCIMQLGYLGGRQSKAKV